MGFFKDVHTLKTMGKEMQKTSDPGGDTRRAADRMRAMNTAYAQAAAAPAEGPADGVEGAVQVLGVGATTGSMNGDPILSIQVLAVADGFPPVPATVDLVVPMGQLHRVRGGAALPARISRSDPSSFTVEWAGI